MSHIPRTRSVLFGREYPLPWEIRDKAPPPGFEVPGQKPTEVVKMLMSRAVEGTPLQESRLQPQPTKSQETQSDNRDTLISRLLGSTSSQQSCLEPQPVNSEEMQSEDRVADEGILSAKGKPLGKCMRRDIFEIPDSDEDVDTIMDSMPPIITNTSIESSSTIPAKRNAAASDDYVETVHGRRKIVKTSSGKGVEKLLQRGKHGNRVWYYCKYKNKPDEDGDVVYQTDLKKLASVAKLINAWEKEARSNKM